MNSTPEENLTEEQKQYLQGFFAGTNLAKSHAPTFANTLCAPKTFISKPRIVSLPKEKNFATKKPPSATDMV